MISLAFLYYVSKFSKIRKLKFKKNCIHLMVKPVVIGVLHDLQPNAQLVHFLPLVCHHVTSAPRTATGAVALAVHLVPMMGKLPVLEL